MGSKITESRLSDPDEFISAGAPGKTFQVFGTSFANLKVKLENA